MNSLASLLLLFLLTTSPSILTEKQSIEGTLDLFHQAAADAQFEHYFSFFTEDGVFLGTDASERWTVDAFKAYARPHFEKGRGWAFIPTKRNVVIPQGSHHASFDEILLSKSYGVCRGTGVLRKVGELWKIEQYHLTIPIPNEHAKEVVELIRSK